MPDITNFISSSLENTNEIGKQIHELLTVPACVYLKGDLGMGKTTLCQSIIAAFGVTEAVTSPTYNLIHQYAYKSGTIYHLDLYRINDPQELEFLALSDLWANDSVFLVEWPDKGGSFLQEPSHEISISSHERFGRNIEFSII